MDDELKGTAAVDALGALGADSHAARLWERYHLISDALSNHLTPYVGPELAQRVRQALEHEPHFLPARRTRWAAAGKTVGGLALAASLVGVVVVTGERLNRGDGVGAPVSVASVAGPSAPATAEVAEVIADEAPAAGTGWERLAPEMETRLNGYLVSHSTYSDRMSPVRPYARVVSYHGAR